MGLQTLRPSISGRQTGMVFLWAPEEALLSCLELIAGKVTATFAYGGGAKWECKAAEHSVKSWFCWEGKAGRCSNVQNIFQHRSCYLC